MDLLATLGIDWKLLLAQLINFLVVLLVLYQFVYKPLFKFLQQRQERISQSLSKAEQIDKEFKALQDKKQMVINEAKQEAYELIKQAGVEAEARRQEILSRVREESERVIAETRARFAAEQGRQLQHLRQQAARLVTQALTKVVTKLPPDQIDQSLVEDAIKEVAKHKADLK